MVSLVPIQVNNSDFFCFLGFVSDSVACRNIWN